MQNKRNKKFLLEETAKRALFMMSDAREFWNTLEDLIYEITKETADQMLITGEKEREVINVIGLFKIKVVIIAAHTGYDARNRKPIELGDNFKVIMVPSRKFAHMLNGWKHDPRNIVAEEDESDD